MNVHPYDTVCHNTTRHDNAIHVQVEGGGEDSNAKGIGTPET
jgi:hypothetical protein